MKKQGVMDLCLVKKTCIVISLVEAFLLASLSVLF